MSSYDYTCYSSIEETASLETHSERTDVDTTDNSQVHTGPCGSRDLSRDDESFQSKVNQFTAKHKDVIEQLCLHDDKQGPSSSLTKPNMYRDLPPLEYHMKVSIECRQEHVLQLLVPGQVIEGYITNIRRNYGMIIEITSLINCSKHREVSDLELKGLVKVENLTRDPSKGKKVICDYQEDDVIRAIIIGNENEYVLLSFCADENLDLKLGYVDKDLLFPKISKPTDYIDQVITSTGFRNPSSVDSLKSILGIPSGSCTSLLRPILMEPIKKEEYYDSLRKAQRVKWSMDTVASGIKCFKSKQYEEALKYFKHALEIDSENVEALVARGALYANNGHYLKAIIDFESALTLNHTHSNAKKYLVETQTAYGQEFERKGEIKQALHCYREALADNPSSEPAKSRASILTAVLEKKAAEQKEKERKKQMEESRLKKLQKIIDKEHLQKKKRKKHRKSTSKKRRRDYSSSSSDSNG